MDIRIIIAALIGILLPLLLLRPRSRARRGLPPVHRWRHRVALNEGRYPYHAKTYLLTRREREFYRVLQTAAGDQYLIAMSVRLADVIGCSRRDWTNGHGPLISSKQLDFVLCEPETTRIIAAVELDDPTHRHPDRAERDEFLDNAMRSAGVPLLRFQTAKNP